VGLTGQKSNIKVIAVIPARYHSTRLPGKMLLPLAGKPLILHTVEKVSLAHNVDRVIVATDHKDIQRAVKDAGYEAVMTSEKHRSGSDRIAQVAKKFEPGTIVVNVQGDEPLISPETISLAVQAMLKTPEADIVTCWERIRRSDDLVDPNVVKVVTDRWDFALYFSRSPIPFHHSWMQIKGDLNKALRQSSVNLLFKKHVGLYVYRQDYLIKYAKMPRTFSEAFEGLEQLRALENGARIKVIETRQPSIGVDTKKDYLLVKKILETTLP
jgi:3-deoxy-manno-octulosonate cytidylyltransferase (CMP-KDO synthetase)